jgi:hypothetical protein
MRRERREAGRIERLWRVGARLTVIVLWVVLAAGLLRPVRAEGPNRVGIWVGGTKKCATFSGDSINAMTALQQAYDVESSSGAVCKIGNTGCPASDCWCKCPVPDDKCEFWSYWHLKGDQWVYGNVGASQYELRNGEIDGWLWGHQPQNGNTGPSQKPSIDDFCPRATDTPVPTSTPAPTDTPAPTLTPTLAPTPTRKPTATKVPAASIDFSLSPEQVAQGACANLKWTVKNAKGVYLNGDGVSGEESRQVCPQAGSQAYELRVVSLDGHETNRQVILNVTAAQSAPQVAAPAAVAANGSAPAQLAAAGPPTSAGASDGTGAAASASVVAPDGTAEEVNPEIAAPTATLAPDAAETATAPRSVALAQPGEEESATAPAAVLQNTPDAAPAAKPAGKSGRANGGLLGSKTAWFVLLATTALGAVGFGGLAFVGLLVVLGLIYWRVSRHGSDGNDSADR